MFNGTIHETSMAMFNSYVKLPEGIILKRPNNGIFLDGFHGFLVWIEMEFRGICIEFTGFNGFYGVVFGIRMDFHGICMGLHGSWMEFKGICMEFRGILGDSI